MARKARVELAFFTISSTCVLKATLESVNTKIFSTMNLFQDVIMYLIFTNDGFYFVS